MRLRRTRAWGWPVAAGGEVAELARQIYIIGFDQGESTYCTTHWFYHLRLIL